MVSNHQPIRAVVLRESPNSSENERRRGGGGPRRRVIGSYMESQLSHHQYTLCRITALIDRSPSTSPLPSPIYLAPPPFPALWLHSASRIPLNPTPHISSHLRKKKKKNKPCLFYFKIAAFMIHFPHRFLSGIGDVTAFFPFVSISGWIKTPKLYPSKKKKSLNKNTSKTLQTTVLFCMLDITQTKEP